MIFFLTHAPVKLFSVPFFVTHTPNIIKRIFFVTADTVFVGEKGFFLQKMRYYFVIHGRRLAATVKGYEMVGWFYLEGGMGTLEMVNRN